MNNAPIVFNFNSRAVRVIKDAEGNPLFVAKDICRILELGSPHKVLERLDDDEKGRSSIPTLGGNQEMAVVNEFGLYALTLGCRKPEAKPFKRWVTHEVLPAIRKTGSYNGDNCSEVMIPASEVEAVRVNAIRQGFNFRVVLDSLKFDLADVARLLFYRANGLTQVEAAKLFDMPVGRVRAVEKRLEESGLMDAGQFRYFPQYAGAERRRMMFYFMDSILGVGINITGTSRPDERAV